MSLDGLCRMFQVEGTASAKAPEVETRLGCLKDSLGGVAGVGRTRGEACGGGRSEGGHESSRFQGAAAAMSKDLCFCSE